MNFKLAYFIFLLSEIVCCLIFSFVTAWEIALLFLAIIPFIIVSLVLLVYMLQKYTKLESEANNQTGTIAYEILTSIRTVITFGIQRKAINIYSEKLKVVEKCGIRKGLFRGIFEGIFMGLVYFSYGIGLV